MKFSYFPLTTEVKVFGTTSRYIQGPGVIKSIGNVLLEYGIKRPLVLGGETAIKITEKHGLFRSLQEARISYVKEFFGKTPCGPECCDEEINRLSSIVKESECDAVIGIGGGKAIDTARAVAGELRVPVIMVPTIASTDAPCSAVSAIYTCDHVFKEYRFFPKNPDVVLVDTRIIAEAPTKLLVCGIGDALGKYAEVPSCLRTNTDNLLSKPLRGKSTLLAVATYNLVISTILTYGEEAVESVERSAVTPALEAVVEAIILHSQITFECIGHSAARSIYNGFTALRQLSKYKNREFPCHGELEFFGALVEMVMDGYPREEIVNLMKFAHRVGLSINLNELGFSDIDENEVILIAKKATLPGETIHNKPYRVTPERVVDAMKTANTIGIEVAKQHPIRKIQK